MTTETEKMMEKYPNTEKLQEIKKSGQSLFVYCQRHPEFINGCLKEMKERIERLPATTKENLQKGVIEASRSPGQLRSVKSYSDLIRLNQETVGSIRHHLSHSRDAHTPENSMCQ